MIERFKSMKLYPKLLLFFLVSILPLYAVSWYTVSLGSKAMEQEIRASASAKTRYYMETFKSNMVRILQIIHDYSSDDDIDMLSNLAHQMTQFERFQAINRIRSKLLALKNTSPFIKEARLYVPLLERTIDSAGYHQEVMEQAEIEAIAANYLVDGPFVRWEDRLLFGIVYPGRSSHEQPPTFVLAVELDQKEIRRSLARLLNDPNSTIELRHESEGWTISSSGRKPITDDLEQRGLLPGDPAAGHAFLTLEDQQYFMTHVGDSELAISIYLFVPEQEIYGTFRYYQRLIIVLAVLMLLLILFVSFGVHGFIHRPLVRLIQALRRVERGDFETAIETGRRRDEFDYVYSQFNSMLARLKQLIQENYEQKILAQRSELKQLQTQINPHFLYNSFFILYQLVDEGDRQQSLMLLKHLRTYFQFITRNAEDKVPLQWEMEHALSYLYIQQMRFEDRIRVEVDPLPESFRDIQVPRLIVQPVIENAYKYGLEDKAEDGLLILRFREDDSMVYIQVEDNGESLSDDDLAELEAKLRSENKFVETTGLVNIHRRLNIFFSGKGGLSVARGEHGGLSVVLCIPKEGG